MRAISSSLMRARPRRLDFGPEGLVVVEEERQGTSPAHGISLTSPSGPKSSRRGTSRISDEEIGAHSTSRHSAALAEWI